MPLSAMIVKEAPRITAMLASLIVGKAAIITALSLIFGMSFANAQLSGLLLAQGGAVVHSNTSLACRFDLSSVILLLSSVNFPFYLVNLLLAYKLVYSIFTALFQCSDYHVPTLRSAGCCCRRERRNALSAFRFP